MTLRPPDGNTARRPAVRFPWPMITGGSGPESVEIPLYETRESSGQSQPAEIEKLGGGGRCLFITNRPGWWSIAMSRECVCAYLTQPPGRGAIIAANRFPQRKGVAPWHCLTGRGIRQPSPQR